MLCRQPVPGVAGLAMFGEGWFGRQMEGGAFSAGVRLTGKQRPTWDITLVGAAFDGSVGASPIPLVGLTIPF